MDYVDCPDAEHVVQDWKTGIPLQVLSLNLGISRLKGSAQQLASSMEGNQNVAVLHCQEARLKKHEVPKWWKHMQTILPKYTMYAHCTSLGS